MNIDIKKLKKLINNNFKDDITPIIDKDLFEINKLLMRLSLYDTKNTFSLFKLNKYEKQKIFNICNKIYLKLKNIIKLTKEIQIKNKNIDIYEELINFIFSIIKEMENIKDLLINIIDKNAFQERSINKINHLNNLSNFNLTTVINKDFELVNSISENFENEMDKDINNLCSEIKKDDKNNKNNEDDDEISLLKI